MNTDDWNFLLRYAEDWPGSVTEDDDRRHEIVITRFRQWLLEAENTR